jgi:hypothetical protein
MLNWFDGAPVEVTVPEKIPDDREIILAWNDLVFRMERRRSSSPISGLWQRAALFQTISVR